MSDHPQLTPSQERKRKGIERRLRSCLKDLADLSREAGISNPYFYYECEGQLHVFDMDHPRALDEKISRQEAVAFCLDLCGRQVRSVLDIPHLDCGAW